MSEALERVIARLRALPAAEQEWLAAYMELLLDDEVEWRRLLDQPGSQQLPSRMAEEVPPALDAGRSPYLFGHGAE